MKKWLMALAAVTISMNAAAEGLALYKSKDGSKKAILNDLSIREYWDRDLIERMGFVSEGLIDLLRAGITPEQILNEDTNLMSVTRCVSQASRPDRRSDESIIPYLIVCTNNLVEHYRDIKAWPKETYAK